MRWCDFWSQSLFVKLGCWKKISTRAFLIYLNLKFVFILFHYKMAEVFFFLNTRWWPWQQRRCPSLHGPHEVAYQRGHKEGATIHNLIFALISHHCCELFCTSLPFCDLEAWVIIFLFCSMNSGCTEDSRFHVSKTGHYDLVTQWLVTLPVSEQWHF